VVGVIDAGKDKLFFMITAEEVDVEVLLLLDEKVDDLFGIGSPVNIVTHEDDVIFGLGVERFPEREQGFEAAVNVADGEGSHSCEESFGSSLRTVKNGIERVVSFATGLA